jgi:CubicO group peptidase (beta-lactamase class C family)
MLRATSLIALLRPTCDLTRQFTRVFAAVFTAIALNAASQPPAAPTLQTRLDGFLAPLSKGAAPGCAAGIIAERRWLARGGYGLASIEGGVRITPDTIFYAASVSKQFTAAAVLRLVDVGVLTYHLWYRHNMVCGASRNTVAWTSRPQARPPRP